MKIFRTFLTIAIATLASTATLAEQPEARTFERDGITYRYTATEADGKTVLRGTADGGVPFRLVVTKNKVRGTVGSKYVTFARPKESTSDTAVIAAR